MAGCWPGCDVLTQRSHMRHAALQTRLGEYSAHTCGTLEPTAMLRRIGKCHLPREPACFGRRQGFIERGGRVGSEMIDDQAHPRRLWNMHVAQLLHLHGAVSLGAALGNVNVPPATQRVDEEKELGRAFAALCIIVPPGLAGPAEGPASH